MRRVRTAILISGSGSNMVALARAAASPAYPAEIVRVIANVAEAGGIAKAAAMGLPTAVIEHRLFGKDRAAFEAAIQAQLMADRVELVALAGFMRILTSDFVRRWQGRLLNIHPSLLPKFKGLDTHARAIAAGETQAGCTVHEVIPDLDAGPILMQASVAVLPGDTAEALASRVLVEEHRIYPLALAERARELLEQTD